MFERLAIAMCAVAMLFNASACGKDVVEPKPLDSSSESSASPQSAAPSLPPEARQKNEAGVKATGKAFVAARNAAGKSGDTSAFKSLYTEDCSRCVGTTRGIQKKYSKDFYGCSLNK